MPDAILRNLRHRFRAKLAAALALVIFCDWLFYRQEPDIGFGLFALAVVVAALLVRPGLLADRRAGLALAAAAVLALLMIERPTPTVWMFIWIALGVAVLSARAPAGEDVWRWAQRLLAAGLKALGGPFIDGRRLGKLRRRGRPSARALLGGWLSAGVLPLIGGLIFLLLFASANPVIEAMLKDLPPPPEFMVSRIVLWGVFGTVIWGALRPRGLRRAFAPPDGRGDLKFVGVTPASLTLALVVFNALFALQNGLDIAFLWSGAELPEGVTLADYAHRGAYLLIVTAILAGAFVLIALRPGSVTAARPLVRWMIVLFVAQNLLLVASSALRTLDYVEAYGLTRLRISALAWMALVALGLALISVRLLRDKSSSWLINVNAAAAALVLLAASIVDLGAVAASWNVRNAREVNGHGPRLDVCYLRDLGSAALLPLVELESRPLPLHQYEAVVSARRSVMEVTTHRQSQWRTWSWRDQRRLDAASARLGQRPPPPPTLRARTCAGELVNPPRPAPPLTAPAQPRT